MSLALVLKGNWVLFLALLGKHPEWGGFLKQALAYWRKPRLFFRIQAQASLACLRQIAENEFSACFEKELDSFTHFVRKWARMGSLHKSKIEYTLLRSANFSLASLFAKASFTQDGLN